MKNIIENYKYVFINYVTFEGRAKRSEYWYFFLANIIVSMFIGFIDGMFGISTEPEQSILVDIYSIVIFIPSIAVGIRRLHDSDKSGWWLLLPFYNLYLLIRKGTIGPNRFGADTITPELAPIPPVSIPPSL